MRLIDANKIRKMPYASYDNITGDGMTPDEMDAYNDGINVQYKRIKEAPTVDAIPVNVIESWLYSIALNNVDNSLGDACEEIILRLNGLVQYNADWKEGDSDGI